MIEIALMIVSAVIIAAAIVEIVVIFREK